METFYKDLGSDCESWYTMMSNKYAMDANQFTPYVEDMGDHKYMIMNYAREQFHAIKENMFTIVDGLRDSQRVIESTQSYFLNKSLKLMDKRIDSPQWKYQLKYSTKMTKRCAYDHDKVTQFATDLDTSSQVISRSMTDAKVTFSENATADWKAWNCKEMYPKP